VTSTIVFLLLSVSLQIVRLTSPALQARIIHEYCRETVETEAHRGWSQAKLTQAYKRSVEEAEREQSPWARGSAVAVDIHE